MDVIKPKLRIAFGAIRRKVALILLKKSINRYDRPHILVTYKLRSYCAATAGGTIGTRIRIYRSCPFVCTHFNQESALYSRDNFRLNRPSALAEWHQIGAA